MTSQHDAPKLIFSISACRCARKMILFFVSMKLWVAEFENVVSFVFAWWRHVMTSCHDVKNRRYSISACRSARLERWFFFCFYSFPARSVWICYRFLCLHDVITSWRDVMTSQNSFLLYQLVDVLKWWYTCISVDISVWWVPSHHRVCICMMSLCYNGTSWRH